MQKNFFAILSSPKGREFESRELEILPPKIGDFYFANNQGNVAKFVFNHLVSKFIHLINTKPNYQNRGRLDLASDRDLQYSESEIKAILQIYFNRDDADCSVLFLSGHGAPKGEVLLWSKEGEFPFSFQTVKELWDLRTSKQRNRELLIIVDSCFSGNWVFANQQPDIFVQSSCANKEKARDIRVNDTVVGSVFLHNLLMLHGVTDCFFEGVNQTPTCTFLKGDQIDRVKNIFELEVMKRNWDDFKFGFKEKVKSFNRDSIIWAGPNPFEGSPMGRQQIVMGGNSIGGGLRGSGMVGLSGGPFGGQIGMDINRSVTVTTTTINGEPGNLIKEENVKRSFQGGNSSSQSSGGSYMFKFGMN